MPTARRRPATRSWSSRTWFPEQVGGTPRPGRFRSAGSGGCIRTPHFSAFTTRQARRAVPAPGAPSAPEKNPRPDTQWTSRPHVEHLSTKSSSSRSRSAFTLSSSSRSIFAWTTSGSERPCPTATPSSTRSSALEGLLGDGVDGVLEDLAPTACHGAGRLERLADHPESLLTPSYTRRRAELRVRIGPPGRLPLRSPGPCYYLNPNDEALSPVAAGSQVSVPR